MIAPVHCFSITFMYNSVKALEPEEKPKWLINSVVSNRYPIIVERTGAVVKPRTLGREVPGSSPPVAVRCGLEQVSYPQLLR